MDRRLIVNLFLIVLLTCGACSSPAGPAPVSDSQGTYSLETRTGVEEIDNILTAVASGEPAQLEKLIALTTAPCTTRDGLGGPPKCRDGEAEGTLVEALPVISSEGSFVRRDELDNWTGVDADSLFAVYRVSEDGINEQYYPRGEYAIVFLSAEHGMAVTLRILHGRVVRVDYLMYDSLRNLQSRVVQDSSEVILMSNIR